MKWLIGLSVTSRPIPEELQLRQEREVSTLEQLEKIMSKEAFDDFPKQRSKKAICEFKEHHFCPWFNKYKSNPDLQKILTEKADTDAVKELKRRIVQYEMDAVTQMVLGSAEGRHDLPNCLRLKAEDLFDQDNNYLIPNPNMEINWWETDEVLVWHREGVKSYISVSDREEHFYSSRSPEITYHSEAEVVRKLKKYLAVGDQRALKALTETMPAGAREEFHKFLNDTWTRKVDYEPGNPLVRWYNSLTDNDPEFLKQQLRPHWRTKTHEAFCCFLRKYEGHARQQLRDVLGESLYHVCCMSGLSIVNYGREYYTNADEFLRETQSRLSCLPEPRLQQLLEGEFRHAPEIVQVRRIRYEVLA